MIRIELLTVKDSFQINGRGVVVIPDFSVPDGWRNRAESVTVAMPDGHQYEATAQFSMSHFNITGAQFPTLPPVYWSVRNARFFSLLHF